MVNLVITTHCVYYRVHTSQTHLPTKHLHYVCSETQHSYPLCCWGLETWQFEHIYRRQDWVYNTSYILLPLCLAFSPCKPHLIIPQQWYKFGSPVLHQHFIYIMSHWGNLVHRNLHKNSDANELLALSFIHNKSCTFSYNYVSVFQVIPKSLKTLQEALRHVSIFYEIIFREFFIYFLVDVADIKNY